MRRYPWTAQRWTFLVVLALTAIAVGAAGAAAAGGGKAAVQVRATSLGRILVDSQGRSLYLFEKDKGGKSACYGQCAKFWPPLLASGKPVAGAGAKSALLGETRRTDGMNQVTYAGHPLYRFLKDKKAGQTKGQNLDAFGAEWYVLSPAGKKIEKG
jgi:predicted lipoprotein with Yx(FWY)xxD motif